MLDAISEACEAFINAPVLDSLTQIATEATARNGIAEGLLKIVPDDKDKQTLLARYPTATEADAYIPKAVKIESGASSAPDPNSVRSIRPYLEEDAPGLDLEVPGVTIVDAERTFWDKVIILYGLHRWYELKGVLKGGDNRISRHYYDLHETHAGAGGTSGNRRSGVGGRPRCARAHVLQSAGIRPGECGTAHLHTHARRRHV